ncbi:hypothetical protein K6V06_02650 [Cupriavidus sp. AU9028]|nr:hypothetical protein [Cupriavidus sp. AU9028]
MALCSLAHASDINCDPAASTSANVAPAHRLICESALFSMGDQRIHAEQQRLLRSGELTEAEIAAFRQRRDRCDTASCLDTVLREERAALSARSQRKP